jgi:ubiquinone/menaquinone biosynthesis C-methylase UbiE
VPWLDHLYRHPFGGRSARRYAALEHPAFGDLEERLLDELRPVLTAARRLLDLGAGPYSLAARAAARHPGLDVIAVEPSADFVPPSAGQRQQRLVHVVRAVGEQLPLATTSIDVAVCLSSIRHVRDRGATLRELRRVVREGGLLVILELDPAASRARIAAHADRLGSWLLRRAFGPLVVRTAPPRGSIETLACASGWTARTRRDDPVQPVYILELV